MTLEPLTDLRRHWTTVLEQRRQGVVCGFVGQAPSERALQWMRRISAALVWVQIGKVEIEGAEWLSAPSPLLILPNHGHYLDPFVLALVLPRPARCMAARGLMSAAFGFAGALLTSWGAFCVDLDRGKGVPALKAAMRLLASGQDVVMFPEGWACLDGRMAPFKAGLAVIARRSTQPLSLLPVFLRYGTYPGGWIRRLPMHLQLLAMLLGIPFLRRGVRIVVGPPIPPASLPDAADAATEAVQRAVMALDPAASAA